MEKILIVDDEAFIRENLEKILVEDGYRPYSTESPENDKAFKLRRGPAAISGRSGARSFGRREIAGVTSSGTDAGAPARTSD